MLDELKRYRELAVLVLLTAVGLRLVARLIGVFLYDDGDGFDLFYGARMIGSGTIDPLIAAALAALVGWGLHDRSQNARIFCSITVGLVGASTALGFVYLLLGLAWTGGIDGFGFLVGLTSLAIPALIVILLWLTLRRVPKRPTPRPTIYPYGLPEDVLRTATRSVEDQATRARSSSIRSSGTTPQSAQPHPGQPPQPQPHLSQPHQDPNRDHPHPQPYQPRPYQPQPYQTQAHQTQAHQTQPHQDQPQQAQPLQPAPVATSWQPSHAPDRPYSPTQPAQPGQHDHDRLDRLAATGGQEPTARIRAVPAEAHASDQRAAGNDWWDR